MGLFHSVTDKEILAQRKRIVLDVAIPALLKQRFERSPFSTAWFGYYPGNHFYMYELCRLQEGALLELVRITVHGGERWIQIHVNVFRLHPPANTLGALSGQDGLYFHMPPHNRTLMRLRLHDRPGPPIFWIFAPEHRLESFWTRSGFERGVKRLSRLIEQDMNGIDVFFKRWHQLHKPHDVDWTGQPMLVE